MSDNKKMAWLEKLGLSEPQALKIASATDSFMNRFINVVDSNFLTANNFLKLENSIKNIKPKAEISGAKYFSETADALIKKIGKDSSRRSGRLWLSHTQYINYADNLVHDKNSIKNENMKFDVYGSVLPDVVGMIESKYPHKKPLASILESGFNKARIDTSAEDMGEVSPKQEFCDSFNMLVNSLSDDSRAEILSKISSRLDVIVKIHRDLFTQAFEKTTGKELDVNKRERWF